MQNNLTSRKIVFFGTPNFTVEFLDLFKSLGLEICAVVTGRDKPVGRGMQVKPPFPKVWAEQNNIPHFQPDKLDDSFFSQIENMGADLFIVIAYGKIIPEKIINLPKYGTINLHYSILPKYRGATPVESAILNNEEISGITIQQMVFELDAGDIIFQAELKINQSDTTTELRNRMNSLSKENFPLVLSKIFGEQIEPKQQNKLEATFTKKISKAELDVTDLFKSNDISSIFTKYKAYDKKVFFFVEKNGTDLRVKITDMNENEILKVLPESKKEISYSDFKRNYLG